MPTDSPPTRPVALALAAEEIPDDLKALPQWVVWKYVPDGEGDWDKPPLCVRGGPASSTDPRTWAAFPDALAAYRAGGLDGIGFCLHPEEGGGPRLVGVDLDDCRDPRTAEVEEWARAVLGGLLTYTEVSPSGTGLRLFVRGRLPPSGRKKGPVEMYERARYVTVTGQRLPGRPRSIRTLPEELAALHGRFWPPAEELPSAAPEGGGLPPAVGDADLVAAAMAARDGEKFRALWGGDWSAYGSHSEADLALCNLLAFWCGPGGEGRVADLFSQSGLFRSKWQREDYRRLTVGKAYAGRAEFYTEPGRPLGTIHANGKHRSPYTHPEETAPPPDAKRHRTVYTLPELLSTTLPETVWTVPGILSEGMTILAGKPKLGKSMLALNLAIVVAASGRTLGGIQTAGGDVLYLSLEDRFRRVKYRAEKMLRQLGVAASARLTIAIQWERQGGGGLGKIEEWMKSCQRPALVIVDVWQKFRPMFLPGSQYEQDYNHASALKALGDRYACSILPLHHCKKAKADDVVDEVSGTLGLAGAADGLLVMSRARSDMEAELFVTGRDAQERKLALRFDPESFVWHYVGEAAERTESKLKAGVLALLKHNAGVIFPLSEIMARLSISEDKRAAVRSLLSKMTDDELIVRIGVGRFRWPVEDAPVQAIPEGPVFSLPH